MKMFIIETLNLFTNNSYYKSESCPDAHLRRYMCRRDGVLSEHRPTAKLFLLHCTNITKTASAAQGVV